MVCYYGSSPSYGTTPPDMVKSIPAVREAVFHGYPGGRRAAFGGGGDGESARHGRPWALKPQIADISYCIPRRTSWQENVLTGSTLGKLRTAPAQPVPPTSELPETSGAHVGLDDALLAYLDERPLSWPERRALRLEAELGIARAAEASRMLVLN